MDENLKFTENTQKYFSAQRTISSSGSDDHFIDATTHSPDLVRSVIVSYMNVFLKPMLTRANIK